MIGAEGAMTMVTQTDGVLPLMVPYQPARISLEAYHRLSSIGVLPDGAPVELLRGVLAQKKERSPPYVGTTLLVYRLLMPFIVGGWNIRMRLPITLTDSEPEPDVAIVREQPGTQYRDRHPNPDETELIVEVASESLATDRYKAELYAEAGIPWYWLVNLPARRFEVYSQPASTLEGLRYGEPQVYQAGDSIPVILDGKVIGTLSIDDLLPAAGA